MRSVLFVMLLLPVLASSQINRSAREFASEKIGEYITSKLFKDMAYKPVSFGELKPHEDQKIREITWSIEHQFEITEHERVKDRLTEVQKPYKFVFFLDNRMRVQKAESYQVH